MNHRAARTFAANTRQAAGQIQRTKPVFSSSFTAQFNKQVKQVVQSTQNCAKSEQVTGTVTRRGALLLRPSTP